VDPAIAASIIGPFITAVGTVVVALITTRSKSHKSHSIGHRINFSIWAWISMAVMYAIGGFYVGVFYAELLGLMHYAPFFFLGIGLFMLAGASLALRRLTR
jgi:hypothetical protein